MEKILIANRGEIAVRIIRTAKQKGIKTVAVHSECDAQALHVRLADESICIGGNRVKDSYLNTHAIMSACEVSQADAIHPGYGLLSENAEFAQIVEDCKINFIGPSPTAMRRLGEKVSARELAEKANVPLLKGTGIIRDSEHALEEAEKIGYPVLIKASHGGGGRGMRVVDTAKDMAQNLASAQSESQGAFGSSEVYMEKFLKKPRHIEIQILADKHGNCIYLGERECSLQRRHQKIIEEALSPITEETREKMGLSACRLAQVVDYCGLGTVEFLVDEDETFYFMEMNSRIQVEHPVTEMVTGLDLVSHQIDVAQNKKLALKQEDIRYSGHAIECRINAEDSYNFIPSPGEITTYVAPGGPNVRIDSGVYQGYKVPPFYDSMLAKLICWGKDRAEARLVMLRALSEFVVEGVNTNIELHKKIIESDDFINSNYYTKWIEEQFIPSIK